MDMPQILLLILAVPVAYLLLFLLLRLENGLPASAADGSPPGGQASAGTAEPVGGRVSGGAEAAGNAPRR